jgi:myotubularin-related protein 6/7/8
MALEHSHVLIHCSDGWDRTSQLSSLSQICLDPYFRTIDGFMALVEKDWVSLGQMFRYHGGFLASDKWFIVKSGNGVSAEEGYPAFG